MIKKLLTNSKIENFLGRVLYFHNTLDTHFILMGVIVIFTYHWLLSSLFVFGGLFTFLIYGILLAIFFSLIFKLGDFYVSYLFFIPLFFYLLFWAVNFNFSVVLNLAIIVTVWFFASQLVFFGAAYIIILKDFTTPFRIAFNSLFTLASTTASFVICFLFTTLFVVTWLYRPNPFTDNRALIFFLSLIAISLLVRIFIPRNREIVFVPPKKKIAKKVKRVIILNIDGCSFNKFSKANKPNIENLKKEGCFYKNGALTVYRGLTNPAFASILTGTIPQKHGVVDNNFTSSIKIDALPDIVKTIIYGCVHMKQFAKRSWPVRVVSLPEYGFAADNLVLDWAKEDIRNDKARFFVIDLSSVDMSGHAYGSYSHQYLNQIERADRLIGSFIDWLKANKFFKDSLIIISSDHGMWGIDHVYLLSRQEREVPLMFLGPQVKQGVILNSQPSIMDIAPTVSYALGVKFLDKMKARTLVEIFK